MILIPAGVAIVITVAVQISMRTNHRVENSLDWHLANSVQGFTGIHMLMAVYEPICMLATVFGYAGSKLLAVYGPTAMQAAVFRHARDMLGAERLACILATVSWCAGNILVALYGPTCMLATEFRRTGSKLGAKRLACILATVSGCAGNILVVVYRPTCMLATVFGYAGSMLLAVYGPTDMLAAVFGHAENMLRLAAERRACILATVSGCAGNILGKWLYMGLPVCWRLYLGTLDRLAIITQQPSGALRPINCHWMTPRPNWGQGQHGGHSNAIAQCTGSYCWLLVCQCVHAPSENYACIYMSLD